MKRFTWLLSLASVMMPMTLSAQDTYTWNFESTNPADFVQVGTNETTTHEMKEYRFDLSAYAGKTGRFAIRHYNCTNMLYLDIDDICLSSLSDPTLPTNLTVTPAATTAKVTWDGAEGDSWNIRYREINPNETQTILWDLTKDNYESQLEGWGIEDRDEDGNNWGLSYGGYDPNNDQLSYYDNVCFHSYSYNGEAFDPDNWLYTPELTLGGTFKFWACNEVTEYLDVLGVYVVTEDGEYQIGEDIIPPGEVWTDYTFDTSAYNGKVGTIAIVHHNSYDRCVVYVDYISYVKEGDEPAEPIEINALTEPSYTISGLKPNTEYVVEVQAYNEMGETEWTPLTHFTTTNSSIATSLNQVTSDKSQVQSEEWYTLDGRKISGVPTKRGVYIQNGKKAIVH